jgi:hypothetical protein
LIARQAAREKTVRAHLGCAWHLRPSLPHILKSALRAMFVVGEDKLRLASDMPELNGSRSPTVDAYWGS